MAAGALLIVRAEVESVADRPAFDRWYATEHLPDALTAFGAARAWRTWSSIEPSSHCAFYEFPDLDAAQAALQSDAIKALIAEFDRMWQGRVTRTRDVVAVVQRLPD